jgi:asparagine synthase (glutamine-hydrolysing)
MCGIYGMVAREGIADGRFLGPMDRALVHRGPDDSGMLVDGRCALGMRRLAIIDLAGGRQPIPSEDRALWVVLNGEIYNHQAIRRALAGRHQFATASDTEVIVHLYEDLGAAFVHELRGMFACAVWDRHEQSLVLARDRLGIKPLYYADTPQGLVFASEVRALLAHPWVGRELDLTALSHYLTFGTTPHDRSIIRGVAKLPPGHVLRWRPGSMAVERYWNLTLDAQGPQVTKGTPGGKAPASEAEAALQVRELLVDAVTSHLVSDVEVGAFLSGGVDSATVVGLMAQAGARPRTFSIGFDESDFDELYYARLVARHFGTRHEELMVRPDVWSLVDHVIQALDEPMADVSALPTYLVSQLAARQVKVVLSGDGGDEVFGGYDHYRTTLAEARRLDGLDAVVQRFAPLRRWMKRTAEALPEPVYGKYWLRHVALDPRMRYVDTATMFSPEMQARLLTGDVRTRLRHLQQAGRTDALDPQEQRARMLENAPGDELGRLLYLDTMTYLPLDILTKVDRMSMAHSLEVRPPLLDTALVEVVAAMPSAWKIAAGEQKRLLKRAVADLVPAEILGRKKRGFGVPIRHWFRGPLREAVAGVLTDRRTRTRGLIEPAAIISLLDRHASGRRDLSLQLWSLLVLELWLRMTLDAPRAQPQPPPGDGRPETRWETPALAGHGTPAPGLLAEGGGC